MVEQKWTAFGPRILYLSDELDSLPDDGNILGDEIDFDAAGSGLYMDIEIYLNTFDLSGQTNPTLKLWLLGPVGIWNEYGTDTITPARPPDAIVHLLTIHDNHHALVKRMLTSPGTARILLKNSCGTNLMYHGNTIYYKIYSERSV